MSICSHERCLRDARMLMPHVVIQEHCSRIELLLDCSSVCRQRSADGRLFIYKVCEIEHAFVYVRPSAKTEWSVKHVRS